MFERPQVWCVVGANGSGKSSICDALSTEGDDFSNVKRDTLMENLWNEFGGYETFRNALLSCKKSVRRKMLKKLKAKMRQLVQAHSWEGYAEYPNALAFSKKIESLLRWNDEELVSFYSRDEGLLYYLVCMLAQVKGLQKAVEKSQKKTSRVLLEDPSLLNERQFSAARAYCLFQEVEVGLLVVRSTREKIIEVAEERFQSGSTQGLWSGRAAAGIHQIDRTVSYPAMDKVIVYDNVRTLEDAVNDIRNMIQAEVSSSIEWPIKLVLS